MLRLTLLLLLAMSAALFTLGEDRGQLRPGLALAKADGRLDEVWAKAEAKASAKASARAVPTPAATPVLAPEPAPVVAEVAPEPVAVPQPSLASSGPVIEVAPARTVVQAVDEPVFTLSALGNELVPGEDGTPVKPVSDPAPLADTPSPAAGTIWYVNASSVNVRAEPSTEAEILGRLGSGEATLLVAAVDGDWARIVIQGDGVEGYVALRFLSPESP